MTNETLFQAAVKATKASLETREIKQGKVRALLGDAAGNLVGPSGAPWVLARLYGDPSRRVEAYNGTPIAPAVDMAVELWVRYENGRATRYDIKGIDSGVTWPGYVPGQNGGLPLHAISHERGGGAGVGGWDAVNVYERMITSLRPDAQVIPDLTLAVAPGYYNIDDQEYYFAGGNTGAFTPPGSGSEYHVVTLDSAGSLNITVAGLTSPPVAFALPAGEIPIAAVYLTAGQTAINESDLLDIRPFLSQGGGASLTPSDTVSDETTWGITPDAGVSLEYSRGDHTHGTPTEPVVVREALWTFEGVLSAQTGALRIYNRTGAAWTISQVFLDADTAPAGANIIVDVNSNGTTIFTVQANRPVIAAGANTGFTTTIDVPNVADGDYLTVDIDQVGSTPGSNLTVHVIFT